MKQIKKIVQWLIVCILCVATLCGTVFADVTDTQLSDAPASTPFPDIPAGADYAEAAATLAEFGIFQGDAAGNFNPNKTISRAEAAAVICRMLGVEEEAKQLTNAVFTDVPASHWAVGYVAKATELKIIGGYGNGKFGPGDPVTFEQMVKMLVCAWGYGEDGQTAGGYPNGYLTVAEKLGVIAKTEATVGIAIQRKTVAQLCYKFLFVYEHID